MSDVNVTVDNNEVNVQVVSGIIEPISLYYGSFCSTQDQTNPTPNQVNKVTYNVTNFASGVSIVSNSRITIANAGIYNIEFSAQVTKTDSGTDNVDIWLCKNGNPVANTNTQLALTGNGAKQVPAWNFFENAAAGDYYELCWSSADDDVLLKYVAAQTSPARPAIPSIILTVNKVA